MATRKKSTSNRKVSTAASESTEAAGSAPMHVAGAGVAESAPTAATRAPARSFVPLTRAGLGGSETIYVNKSNVAWIEPAVASSLAFGVPPPAAGSAVFLVAQPMYPLYVGESVDRVVELLDA